MRAAGLKFRACSAELVARSSSPMQTQVPGASQSQTTLWMAYDGISTSSRPETARVVSPERLDGVKQVCPLFDPKPSSSQKQNSSDTAVPATSTMPLGKVPHDHTACTRTSPAEAGFRHVPCLHKPKSSADPTVPQPIEVSKPDRCLLCSGSSHQLSHQPMAEATCTRSADTGVPVSPNS